jgi:type II secretory pathway component GspD/PulD (secretin)
MRVEEDESPLKLLRTKATTFDTTPRTEVYAVADLVIPVPSALRTPEELPRNGKIQEGAVADFDSLIDLISSTIEPQSWGELGGGGRIESSPTNLSLVVTQSAEVHEQITDLLTQLRRLQDVQITIEAKFISVPKFFFAPGELPGFDVVDFAASGASIEMEVGKPAALSEIEAFFLQQVIERSNDAKLLAAPKITLFNGQQASVSTEQNGAIAATLQFEAVCSADRRDVHLRVATDAETEINSLPLETIPAGTSLLVRLDDSAAAAWSVPEHEVHDVPFLEKIPYVSRLFKSTPRPGERIAMLLVTPQVIVAEEEEELVNVQALGGN